MSVLRLPFTIATVAGIHICCTPPNPNVEGEGKRMTELEGWIQFNNFIPIVKNFLSSVAVIEIVAIIAHNAKEIPISQRISLALMGGNDASRIQIAPFSVLGILLVAYGTWLRQICYRELGKQFTFQISLRENHKLVTTGPYAVVRHPSYTGGSLVILGTLCFYAARGSWVTESGILGTLIGKILSYVVIASVIIPAAVLKKRWETEDEALKKEFGKQWVEWAERVRYAVLPGIL